MAEFTKEEFDKVKAEDYVEDEFGLVLKGTHKPCFAEGIELDGIIYNIHIKENATVIYFLIQVVFIPYKIRDRKA